MESLLIIKMNQIRLEIGENNPDKNGLSEKWFVEYDGICAVIDSTGFTPCDKKKGEDYFDLHSLIADLSFYPQFLKGFEMFVSAVDEQLEIGEGQDTAIKAFDLLFSTGYLINPVETAITMGVDPVYIDCIREELELYDEE